MIKPAYELKARGIEIDLTGPQGNAFNILGLASNLGASDKILSEMRSATYDNLIAVFEREFGDRVTIYV